MGDAREHILVREHILLREHILARELRNRCTGDAEGTGTRMEDARGDAGGKCEGEHALLF